MLYTRAPTSLPSIPQPPQCEQVLFRHPGYDDSNNVLFKLYAVDSHNEARQRPGLYAQFALDACAVIAGNRTDGWLSILRDPDTARGARIDATSMLHERNYYFHLDRKDGTDGDGDGDGDEPYAIVPTFREWRFPHDHLPAHWQQLPQAAPPNHIASPSNLTVTLQIRDGSCRISGCQEELQVAHVVPRAELDWWKGNNMSRYNLCLADTIDDTKNALLLRADLHIAFDKPACDGSGMRLFFHLLTTSPGYEHFYHNRELHTSAIGVEMLYARFAWSLFPLLSGFLSCRTNRRLIIRAAVDSLPDCRGFFAASFCEQFSISATRRRSQSPKKRKPDNESVVDSISTGDAEVCEQELVQDDPKISISASNHRKRPFNDADTKSNVSSRGGKRGRRQEVSRSSSVPRALSPSNILSDHSDASSMTSPNIPPLAQEWLKKERQRSDTQNRWAEEKRWAREVWAGKSLSSHEVMRWLEVSGYDVRDTELERG
ncbi:hypothetical protein GQ44DRAFT_762634 [Phaeosphaeriaceae sp. PMI808]|nr:hypothetical protein GQ44DRAFT_762634 [Phaeosphaeriaceae sp. PMI808]